MAVNIRKLAVGSGAYVGPMIYNYKYDQLNRLGSMDAWPATGSFAPLGTSPVADYSERFGYDPNGNILTLTRHGTGAGTAKNMDSLRYQYIYAKTVGGLGEYVPGQAPTTGVDHLTNQLASIRDDVTSSGYSDIQNQAAQNYQYDAIGNLTGDVQAQVSNITWSVYGKILRMNVPGDTITYTYDAAGNRISKRTHGITTWYVRDATGNVMSVYVQGDNTRNAGALTQSEVHLYGSSRLGVLNLNVNCTTTGLSYPAEYITVRGNKLFELTNHLGNVLATVSDKKLQHTTDSTVVDYYLPDVVGATDYYSFGMPMPGRTFMASGSGDYRYGFNGKENDNEVKGAGNEIDYGMRVYDPRVGRFLSVDPLTKGYPMLTPYQYASNSPIFNIDLDGLEATGWWSRFLNDPVGTIMNGTTWGDANAAAGDINNQIPAGAIINGTFQAATGRDPVTLEPGASRLDGAGNAIIGGIFHYSTVKFAGSASTGAKMERQMAENSAAVTNKPATAAHGGNENAAVENKSATSAHGVNGNTAARTTLEKSSAKEGTFSARKAAQLKVNIGNSTISEDIVRGRLQSQLGENEAILRKPRIYIGDGSTGKYATPDFAVYNTKTGQIRRIVDAKDGEAVLSKAQQQLNKYGGIFKGSSRATDVAPQSVKPNRVEVQKTNITQQTSQP